MVDEARTRAKDVLPIINHMQATEITPGSNRMVPSAADLFLFSAVKDSA